MKSKTLGAAGVLNRRRAKGSSVFDVAANRMSKLGKVDANLVGPTRFQFTFEFAELILLADRPNRAKMSYRLFANRSVIGAATQTIATIANELGRYGLILNRAGDNCEVLTTASCWAN